MPDVNAMIGVVAVLALLSFRCGAEHVTTSCTNMASHPSNRGGFDTKTYTKARTDTIINDDNAIGVNSLSSPEHVGTARPNRHDDTRNTAPLDAILSNLQMKYQHQPIFLQSIQEMALSIQDLLLLDDDFYREAFTILTEPERTIAFRVSWMDDNGHMQINRGWRIEFNSALGPYKGGLRFHPTVDEGILKFLAFEQTFKNALTGLPMGGGKGGSDFDPKGKSDGEIRRFCEAFMTELYRYLHPSTDVPAGDMGVGTREIGYLFGQYKRLTNRHGDSGVLTGKSILIGGSPLRPEATGYGLVYMTQIAIQNQFNRSLEGLRCAVSGSGNVAQYAAQKLIQLGAIVVTLSDSDGMLVFDNGMTANDLRAIMDAKNIHRLRLSSLQDNVSGRYMPGTSPWTVLPDIQYDIALPCATQNEITADDAERMVTYGVKGVLEGANLPTNLEAQDVFRRSGMLYIPGKASNAGGVGVSGFEMSQNAQRLTWTSDDVDSKLQTMMSNIYNQMIEEQASIVPGENPSITLEQGANRAGFKKVVSAMKELGWLY